MPTAARATAAILFGLLGLAFAYQSGPYFPEAKEPFYWYPLNGIAGAILGWMISGAKAGTGYRAGVAHGITTGAAMIFWVYFLMSSHDMIKKSLRKLYDGPVEAVVNVFEIMLDWGERFLVQDLLIFFVAGCILCGLVTEFIGKRLP